MSITHSSKSGISVSQAGNSVSQAENNVPPPSVDEIVRDQVFYMRLCEEQSVVFRQNVEEFTKEYDYYKQSAELPGCDLLVRHKTNPATCRISAKDHTLFKENPAALVDKQFLLEENQKTNCLYKVTEVRFLKGNWRYLVRFEGCFDCVNMSGQEMAEMLKKSSLVKRK